MENIEYIEYRAWIPKLKQFFYWGIGDIEGNGAYQTAPPSDRTAIHQQFTGFMDRKNNKKIYLGDFIKTRSGIQLVTWNSHDGQWSLDDKDTPLHWAASLEREVVGNLFENPEIYAAWKAQERE